MLRINASLSFIRGPAEGRCIECGRWAFTEGVQSRVQRIRKTMACLEMVDFETLGSFTRSGSRV